jgi:hypothetical protein
VQLVSPGVGKGDFALVDGLEEQQHILQHGERVREVAVGIGDYYPPRGRA